MMSNSQFMSQEVDPKLLRAVWFLIGSIILLALVVFCATVRAADELPGKPVTTTAEAVGWALADLATVAEFDRPFQRYVWIPPWADAKWIPSVNFAVNTAASHATTLQLGTPIANGWMLRYDLRRLAPVPKQFDTLRSVWDGLATQDPYFHIPATNTGLAAAVISPHLAQEQAVALAGLSISTGAIYRADFLLVKMLSTLEGGKYYDFLQVPRQSRKRADGSVATPQDDFLASLGVFEEVSQNISGDQRSALFRSNVTGKPRRIDVLHGVGRGGTLATITHDIADEDIAAGQHPIRNLLAFKDRAREIIVERSNGTHAFILTDANGNFQDSAPDNVVRDHTVPPPHTSRLQPAISCVRCHGPFDGMQPFGNDVQKLLASNIDVFADLGTGLSREQAIDRLAGLYAGQLDTPDGPIGRARRDYSAMMYRLTGGVDPFTDDLDSSIAANLSAHVSQVFSSYHYDIVTPERACVELGLLVEAGQGAKGLNYLLGELSQAAVVDPIVGSLRAGISVNRREFEPVYVDMALQAEARRTGKSVSEIRPVQKPITSEKPVVEPVEQPQPQKPQPKSPTKKG